MILGEFELLGSRVPDFKKLYGFGSETLKSETLEKTCRIILEDLVLILTLVLFVYLLFVLQHLPS